MPSPADVVARPRVNAARRALELALRLLAIVALAIALWRELVPAEPGAVTRVATAGDSTSVRAVLGTWSADPDVSAAHLSLRDAPDAITRDWLRALRGAGAQVGWDAPLPAPAAITAEPLPDVLPRVRIAATTASPVMLADGVGVVDSLPAGGGAVIGASVEGVVSARPAADSVRAPVMATRVHDSLLVRRVLVLGMAGWEARFIVAALEEAGWLVDARLAVAPDVAVVQGSVRPDTARHAAVVVVDSSAAPHATAIARYVRMGGGLVLLPEALTLAPFRALAAGARGSALRAEPGRLASEEPRHGLALVPVASPRPDARVLEARDGAVAVAARRVGAGRVVQVGYVDSWRWRLAGRDDAVAAHRAWWSALVSGVAYAPARAIYVPDPWRPLDDAPAARLIAALGTPSPAPASAAAPAVPGHPGVRWLLFAIAVGALLAEWASRRLRGAP